MIKAIIFDCFGVLYPDTFWGIARKYTKDIAGRQQELHDLVNASDRGMIGREELWNGLAEIAGIQRSVIDVELKNMDKLDRELLDYIKQLRTHYKIGMISNVGKGFVERMFTQESSSDYFDDMVLSGEVGALKPDAKIFHLAAERLGLESSECIFIDDLNKNVEGAKAAGMQALQYTYFDKLKSELEPLLTQPGS